MSGSKYVRGWAKGAAVFLSFVLSVAAGTGVGVGVGELVYRLALAGDPPTLEADDLAMVAAVLDEFSERSVGTGEDYRLRQMMELRERRLQQLGLPPWRANGAMSSRELEEHILLEGQVRDDLEAVRRWRSDESHKRRVSRVAAGGFTLLVVLAGWVGALVVASAPCSRDSSRA